MTTVRILDNTGHSERCILSMREYRQIPQAKDHWAYVDGVFRGGAPITQSDIDAAKEIILTPPLRGG